MIIFCTVLVSCISVFFNDSKENATRMCLPNGTWAERADYDQCKALNTAIPIPIEVNRYRSMDVINQSYD